MNKQIKQLMLYSPQMLQNRVETLSAEKARGRESLPIKLFAGASVLLSLFAVGLNIGFNSLAFILPALSIAVYAGVISIGAWGLRSNLRNSIAALKQLTS
ncbi:hypothetical protein [Pseudomonas sp. MWU12-2323]|uniref:hypothetical protein n=1 Tax=Pseudomonas sp. MWU12-2323 TaxID=2651296 RepID=UPI00128CEFBD|nr:hypothetical protein [Pseudomonas sp. MWU12-2323]MPQ69491.1 hypothetical protein [Pseudomonas sp. MWU12-2323]